MCKCLSDVCLNMKMSTMDLGVRGEAQALHRLQRLCCRSYAMNARLIDTSLYVSISTPTLKFLLSL